MTDPIADYLTRIRNAVMANHKIVDIPGSNMKKDITRILFEKGYILNYKFEDKGPQGNIKIALKYHPETKTPANHNLIMWIPKIEKYKLKWKKPQQNI